MTNDQRNLLCNKLYQDFIMPLTNEEKDGLVKTIETEMGLYEQMLKVSMTKHFCKDILLKNLLRALLGAKGDLMEI